MALGKVEAMALDNGAEGLEGSAAAPRGMSGHEKALAAVAAIALAAAVAFFGLFACNSPLFGTAARYSGGSVSEQEVSAWIEQYRGAYGLADDASFAQALASQNMSVASYRQNAIDQLVISKLVEKRASELGLSVSEEEVEARLKSIYGQVAGDDSSLWQTTLENMGVSEDDLRERYRADILQEKVLSEDVALEEAGEEDTLGYISSYLAGTTQLHVMRIVFNTDEGKSSKAEQCLEELKAMKKAGTLDTASFAEMAAQYSEEEGAQDAGGALGWTGSGAIGSDVSEVVDGMGAGELSELATIEADGNALELFYVDEEYSFPEAAAVSSLEALDVPEDLLSAIKAAAAQEAWQLDCTSYLAKLLADARITYYPVPEGASYNVELS
ncbi:MAG: SurA N-terminal domain-containing protein [Coriobacteriales bacterium]